MPFELPVRPIHLIRIASGYTVAVELQSRRIKASDATLSGQVAGQAMPAYIRSVSSEQGQVLSALRTKTCVSTGTGLNSTILGYHGR